MSRWIPAVLAVVLAGCAPKVTTKVYGDRHPARSDTAEVGLYSASLPDCPFEEIALVSVRPQYRVWGAPEDEMFDRLRAQARELGGHAVVGLNLLQAEGESGLLPGVRGTVVRFEDPNACIPPGRSVGAAR